MSSSKPLVHAVFLTFLGTVACSSGSSSGTAGGVNDLVCADLRGGCFGDALKEMLACVGKATRPQPGSDFDYYVAGTFDASLTKCVDTADPTKTVVWDRSVDSTNFLLWATTTPFRMFKGEKECGRYERDAEGVMKVTIDGRITSFVSNANGARQSCADGTGQSADATYLKSLRCSGSVISQSVIISSNKTASSGFGPPTDATAFHCTLP